jgi:exonuclease VII small subunit
LIVLLAHFLLHILVVTPNKKGYKTMNHDLEKKLAELESINDQLSAEIKYLDQLLKQVGFEDGLKTLKSAAQELIDEEGL